jgi:hypothetical protein
MIHESPSVSGGSRLLRRQPCLVCSSNPKYLHRDKHKVVGQVHCGHAALTDLTLDGVAALEGCVQASDGVGLFMRSTCAQADQCASQEAGSSSRFAGSRRMLSGVAATPDPQGDFHGQGSSTDAQTRWIVEKGDSLNIAFVTHLGDFVQHDDSNIAEWEAADAAVPNLVTLE